MLKPTFSKILKKNKLNTEYISSQITPLLLRIPQTLSKHEIKKIILFYDKFGVNQVHEYVRIKQIVPFASDVFKFLKLDYHFWEEKHHQFINRNINYNQIVEKLFESAKKQSISSLVIFENYAVNLLTHDCIGCFSSTDIDLSADFTEKHKIMHIMKKNNFIESFRGKRKKYLASQASTFYNNSIPNGLWINILWVPVVRSFFNQNLISKRLIKFKYQSKNLPNSAIKSLPPTELLYYCCIHIAAGHYFTLSPGYRLYIDIDRLLRSSNKIDWESLAMWMAEDGMSTRVAIVLYLSKIIFNSPVEDRIYINLVNTHKNKILIKNLIDTNSKQIIQKGSLPNRLFIELLSNDF